MNIKKMSVFTAITSVVAIASLTPAMATPTTFAQFTMRGGVSNPFTFTNTPTTGPTGLRGSNSTFTVTGSIPVNFQYEVNNGYGVTGSNIAATMTLTSVVDGKATAVNIGTAAHPKFQYSQGLKSFNLTITAVTAAKNSHGVFSTDLLSLTSSTGTITGLKGANSAGLTGDTTQGDTVAFSSDFLYFGNTINRDFALSFSSLLPTYQLAADGYLANFKTAGTGTFASDPAPQVTPSPEPAPTAAFLIGGMGLALLAFRGRKASRLTA